jgi:UDP-N-acetylmuramate dehydrogenase
MNIKNNFSLAKYNSLNVNAQAKFFADIQSEEQLFELIHNNYFNEHKFIILGEGTNILFAKDFDGIVLHNKITQQVCEFIENEKTIEVHCSSGIAFDDLINKLIVFLQANNIIAFGMENLAKIPGNVGSAVVQNIGAYGVEQKIFFKYCNTLNLLTSEKKKFFYDDCKFNYRSSFFKTNTNPFFITDVCYSIPKNNSPILTYPELKNATNENSNLSVQQIYDLISDIRANKIPDINEFPNAGSFFKNPIVSKPKYQQLEKKFPNIKSFQIGNEIKIPTAWLIEQCGLKGYRKGDVGIYEKHALIVVNYGNANGKNILDFSNYVIQQVKEKFHVEIEKEVVVVGTND